MFSKGWRIHAPLKVRLVKERQMQSLMDKDIATMNGDLVMDTENWVRMWVDTGHAVSSDDGLSVAFRGIDLDGQLMWLVRHKNKRHGYHSTLSAPHDAIAEAEAAWAERARVKARWHVVKGVSRDLITGRKRFRVTRADAHRSALCGAGIDAFMVRLGMARLDGLSGRTAGILMRIEPQLGFAIYAAYERTMTESAKQPQSIAQKSAQPARGPSGATH